MSRSGLTRTKFPANDKLLPTSHATAATPKTSQFLLIGSLLCKAMIVFSRRLRLLGVVGHIDLAGNRTARNAVLPAACSTSTDFIFRRRVLFIRRTKAMSKITSPCVCQSFSLISLEHETRQVSLVD